MDRLATARRAGADRGDPTRREPARDNPATQQTSTASLAAGLFVAVGLAGLAYWQERVANQQRQRAEDTLAAATKTANSLVFDLAQRFRDTVGMPADLVKDILDRARALQEQLTKSGQLTPDLKHSEAEALLQTVGAQLTIGNTAGALSAGKEARRIYLDLLAADRGNEYWQRGVSIADQRVGDVQVVQGSLQDALTSYRGGLAMMERLTKANPDNATWQHDLSISYQNVGDVQVAQGNLQDALTSFRAKFCRYRAFD